MKIGVTFSVRIKFHTHPSFFADEAFLSTFLTLAAFLYSPLENDWLTPWWSFSVYKVQSQLPVTLRDSTLLSKSAMSRESAVKVTETPRNCVRGNSSSLQSMGKQAVELLILAS